MTGSRGGSIEQCALRSTEILLPMEFCRTIERFGAIGEDRAAVFRCAVGQAVRGLDAQTSDGTRDQHTTWYTARKRYNGSPQNWTSTRELSVIGQKRRSRHGAYKLRSLTSPNDSVTLRLVRCRRVFFISMREMEITRCPCSRSPLPLDDARKPGRHGPLGDCAPAVRRGKWHF